MFTESVIIREYDRDTGEGGAGIAYAIFDVTGFEALSDELLMDMTYELDPLQVVYASSERAAEENAISYAIDHEWAIY